MKAFYRIIGVFLMLTVIFSMGPLTVGFAEKEEPKLSTDPRFKMAYENYEKGQKFMKRGHREFRGRPGLAQKHFEYAEDYFNRAVFRYRELGEMHRIDVSHEIAVCERLSREAHVMVNKSRRKRKRPGAGY